MTISTLTTKDIQLIYESAVHDEATKSDESGFVLDCVLDDAGGTGAVIRKLIDMVRARDADLLAVREAQPVFFIEIEGDDWINAGRVPGSTFDFNNLPDGINHLYTALPAPTAPVQELINIANHVAGSADGLPVEWQDWASELVSDLRRLAVSNPVPAVPGDVEFNAWISADENRAETMKCPISLGTARSAWFGCCAAMLQLSGDSEQAVSVVPQSAYLTRAINLAEEAKELADRIRAEDLAPPSVQTDELVMQIRRLVHSLKKAKPDSLLVQQVTEYMKRHGYFKATDCLRGEVEGKN